MADLKCMSELDRIIRKLYSAFKKSKKEKGMNSEESIAYGNAFKKALELGKHDGYILLKRALREEITPKKSHSYSEKFFEDT